VPLFTSINIRALRKSTHFPYTTLFRSKPVSRNNSFLRQWHGPLTEKLVQQPGDFGLGKVPARFKPDATTRSVCGFCSTGCSLDRSEEHTSELQSREKLVCRLLLEKKKK